MTVATYLVKTRTLFRCLAATLVLAAGLVGVVSNPAPVAASHTSDFEIDGDFTSTTGTDWDTLPGAGQRDDVNGTDGVCTTGAEDIYTQSIKIDDEMVPVDLSGNVPDKTDICTSWFGTQTDGLNSYAYGMWCRGANTGALSVWWEFNQSSDQLFPDPTNPDGALLHDRDDGDMLIGFLLGNSGAEFAYAVWDEAAGEWDGPTIIDPTYVHWALSDDELCAEMSIDLRAFGEDIGCSIFSSMNTISQTGGASAFHTANVKDFIAPSPATFETCGDLQIVKETDPGGFSGPFSITLASATTGYNQTLDLAADGSSLIFEDIKYGVDYTLVEATGPGYTLTSLLCEHEGIVADVLAGDAVPIVVNSVVTCTFVNDIDAAFVTIVKDVVDDGSDITDSTAFDFSGAGADIDPTFSLTDDGTAADSVTFPVGIGSAPWSITEGVDPMFDLSDISCSTDATAADVTIDVSTGELVINSVVKDENIVCTFTNEKLISEITVTKTADPTVIRPDGTATFTIEAENTGDVDLTSIVVDDPECTSLTGPTGDDGDAVLNVGETWAYTCTVDNVTAGFTNSATVSGTGPDLVVVEDTDTAPVQVSDLTVVKTADSGTVASGETATFTIEVENTGDADLSGVALDDPQCTTVTGPTGDDGDNILEPGEIWAYSCSVDNVTAGFTNTATVEALDAEGNVVADSDTADVAVSGIAIVKTADTPVVVSGDAAVFTIEVENTGEVDLDPVSVVDGQCDTLTGPAGDDGDGILNPAETWTYTCTVNNVTAGFTNTATATGTDPSGNTPEATDTADVAVSDIAVVKTADSATVVSGDAAVFTIEVENTGEVDLDPVVIDDPQCTTLTGPVGDDGDGILNATEVWTYTCTVNNVTAGFTNTATATGTDPSGNTPEATDTAEVEVAELVVTKTATSDLVVVGQDATFIIEAFNAGETDIVGATMNDQICDAVTGPAGDNGDAVLNPGETWVWTCQVLAVTEGFTNTATVTGTTPGGEPIEGGDTAVITTAGILVEKTGDAEAVLNGATVGYEISVSNPGAIPIDNVTVTDDLCTLAGPNGDDGDQALAPGEVWTYTCALEISENTLNTASAEGYDADGNRYTDSDDHMVWVAKIDLVKSVDQPIVTPGSEVVWKFEITNSGLVPLGEVKLEDPLCDSAIAGPIEITGNGDSILDPNERWSYSCTAVITTNVVNVAMVSGLPYHPTLNTPLVLGNSVQSVSASSTASVTVVADTTPLAFTGSTVKPLIISALLLMVVGSLMLGFRKRRDDFADQA